MANKKKQKEEDVEEVKESKAVEVNPRVLEIDTELEEMALGRKQLSEWWNALERPGRIARRAKEDRQKKFADKEASLKLERFELTHEGEK